MTIRRTHLLSGLALILILAAAGLAAVIRLKVTAELANVRLKPSISSLIVRQIKEGAILEATRKEGEFYLVKLEPDESGNTEGFVHESLVLVLDADAPAEKMPRVVERAEPPRPKPIDETPPVKTEPRIVPRTEPPPVETPRTEEAAAASYPEERRAAFVLTVGGSDVSVGDLNLGAQGLADFYAFQIGMAADKAVDLLHLTFHYRAELLFPLSGRLSVCAGLEYFGGAKETLVSYPQGFTADTLRLRPEFRAIPIKLGIVYFPSEILYLKAGALYAFTRVAYNYRFDHDAFWQDWSGESTAGAFGVFGAVGVEIPVTRTFAFLLEAAGQSLSVSGLSGTGTFQDSTLSSPVTESGKLYSYDGQPTLLNTYPLIFIRSKLPTEGGVANAREAVLSLSGISISAGLKIKF